jgi:uncharacterized protein (DUF1501 family)
MDRRQFLLRTASAAAALTVSGNLYAAPPHSARFLLVFLRGGYDCNNLLVPRTSDFYFEARPHLAIARPDPNDPDSAIALDADWALAPGLRDSIAPLYNSAQAAFVPFAGTQDLSRSHFETQADVESGWAVGSQHEHHSGFLARLSKELNGVAPMAFTDALPLVFQGAGDIPNVSLKGSLRAAIDPRRARMIADLYADDPLRDAVSEGLELREQVASEFADEAMRASRGAVTPRNFESEAQRIGTMMRGRYRLGFVDVGGWDTHVNQGAATGQLANNLATLGRGLAQLATTLDDEWKNTVVVVVSEFGRTFRENGNRGTDHGHGTVYWVLGGGIQGGRILGEQVAIRRETLHEDREYPVLTDYRAFHAGLFRRIWGLSDASLKRIFPGAVPLDLGLV